jgi:hypothetical protein
MLREAKMRGAIVASVLSLAAFGAARVAAAAPSRQACVTAYEETQIAMRRSRLREARAALQTCLDEACPSPLRSDCAGWLKEVETRTPSVVVELLVDGVAAREGKLYVDGQLREGGLDGRAMEVDPGSHAFRVEVGAAREGTAETIVREGEKLKVVKITIGSSPQPASPKLVPMPSETSRPPPSPPMVTTRPVPFGVYAAGALSGLALAGFGVFAISGAGAKSDLDACKPECSQERIDDVRADFIRADVFLGVAAVALGIATYLYVTRPSVQTRVGSLPRIVF